MRQGVFPLPFFFISGKGVFSCYLLSFSSLSRTPRSPNHHPCSHPPPGKHPSSKCLPNVLALPVSMQGGFSGWVVLHVSWVVRKTCKMQLTRRGLSCILSSFSFFPFPCSPYRIFLLYLLRIPYHYYLVAIKQQQRCEKNLLLFFVLRRFFIEICKNYCGIFFLFFD